MLVKNIGSDNPKGVIFQKEPYQIETSFGWRKNLTNRKNFTEKSILSSAKIRDFWSNVMTRLETSVKKNLTNRKNSPKNRRSPENSK